MREIIHVQAGSLSNYTGAHFWNTQESYLVYDEGDIPITDYNVSFKEGHDNHNQPTLFPRLLAFDQKSNFGTLARHSHQKDPLTYPAAWHGDVVIPEHERIPQSEYHSLLDIEDNNDQTETIDTRIRYWSDFSHVLFDPKSVQAIPDTPELVSGHWNASCEAFLRYDDSAELMDGSLRLLMEECDNFQGLKMIQDTPVFGGFLSSFLSAFREENPKATIMTFACLSSISPLDADIGDIKQVLNDTLSLRSVTEFCNLTVPILSPSLWQRDCWFSGYSTDITSIYQSSAILSTYIETVTLPLRLKDSSDDLQTMVAHLNWNKLSPLAALCGTLCPHDLSTKNLHDTPSLSFHSNNQTSFARRDVTRGLSWDDVEVYNTWTNACGLREPFFAWHHLPGYPIPTSFPSIFPGGRPKVLKMMSSLSASSSMGGHLSGYVRFVESARRRHDGTLFAMGLEHEEVKETVNGLRDIIDQYGKTEGSDLIEGMGEDELI